MKIQLKRSDQMSGNDAKEPSISQLEYGELAVNYNSRDPSIFIKTKVDTGGEQLVKIAGANSLAGYPDLDDGNGVNLDTRYVSRTGDTMSGQLTLPGGGNDNQALQKREVISLISDSDTAAGNYVKLDGGDAAQFIVGTGGLVADIFYANRGFSFLENDGIFDSGIYTTGDNSIEISVGSVSKIEIGDDINFKTDVYDKDGQLVSGGGATAKYLCPDGDDVILDGDNWPVVVTDEIGSYIAPAGTNVKYGNNEAQWGAGYSTLFINNSGTEKTGGWFFTCKDPVQGEGSNGKYFGVAAHIQENGNIISDGYTLGLDTIANLDQGNAIRRTGIYRSQEGKWNGLAFGFYINNFRKMLVQNAEVTFDVRANFKEGADGLNFRRDLPDLVEELASKTDLINALTERVAALEARLNQ